MNYAINLYLLLYLTTLLEQISLAFSFVPNKNFLTLFDGKIGDLDSEVSFVFSNYVSSLILTEDI